MSADGEIRADQAKTVREKGSSNGADRTAKRASVTIIAGDSTRAPRLGCAVIVWNEDKILLGVRAKEPFRGKWVIPGGRIRFLENFEQAAAREIHEEAGIDIELEGVVDIQEIVTPPDEHRVVIYCRAIYKGGELRPGSDLSAARFFTKDEVQNLVAQCGVTPTVEKVLRKMSWPEVSCP